MAIWDAITRKEAEDWTYAEIPGANAPGGIEHNAVSADEAYITVTVRSMRIVNVRQGTKKLYGAVQAWSAIAAKGETQGRAEFQVITTPTELKDVDASNLDRVISMERPILGPVPYRGGDLELDMGLFSVVSGDMVGPFLAIAEDMSKAAGVTFVSAALPFVGPLSKAVDILTGTANTSNLEIGVSKQWAPTTGYYAIMRAPRGTYASDQLHIAEDQRLVDANGNLIRDYPYVVFSVEASRERPNWFQVPELKASYDDLRKLVIENRRSEAEEAYSTFRRRTLTSPDLLFADAQTITGKVESELKVVFGPTQTGSGAAIDLSDLETHSPYA